MQHIWTKLITCDSELNTPCVAHDGLPKKFFELDSLRICCEECEQQGPRIQIYRNMLHNVVRISPQEMLMVRDRGLQIFLSNNRPVAYLKPFKKMAVFTNTTNATCKVCPCGRGVDLKSKFCSLQCMLAPKSLPVHRVKTPIKKFECCRWTSRKMRKPLRTFRSPLS